MSKKKALSFSQFIRRFPNEEACFDYLYKVKWPNGFVCPVCKNFISVQCIEFNTPVGHRNLTKEEVRLKIILGEY